MDAIMTKIMPPRIFIILLLASIAFHLLFPIFHIVQPPYNYSGVSLIIFGIIVNLWTDSLFKRHQTTVKPHNMPSRFIPTGPFRLSRHPMYLGMFSILLGSALILGSLSVLIFPVIFIIMIEKFYIPAEERNLKKKFNEEYLSYKKRVRRWI